MTYLATRALSAVITFFAISIVTFIIIQLPPGDYATTYVAHLQAMGANPNSDTVQSIRHIYGLDRPMIQRYAFWMRNFLSGNWGYSFQSSRSVRNMILELLPLTFTIDFLTLVFVWLVALPAAVYTSARRYSLADHVATLLSFLGIAIPNFMIALLLLWVNYLLFGKVLTGIQSQEYIGTSFSFGKAMDSLEHMVLILLVNGAATFGTYMRIFRANLLDELQQPYVETARAMGMAEWRLIAKYPLRVALNPAISNLGLVLPHLISSSTITAIVLSLPTMAPMLQQALLAQDIYLAGGVLMLLGAMIIVGSLVADILLYYIDPRVRFSAV